MAALPIHIAPTPLTEPIRTLLEISSPDTNRVERKKRGKSSATRPQFVVEHQTMDWAKKEATEILKSCLSDLDEKERMIVMFRLEGVGLEKMGEMLGCSHTWIAKLERKALEKLKVMLADKGITKVADVL